MDEIQLQAETVMRELSKIDDKIAKFACEYDDEDARMANIILVMFHCTTGKKLISDFMDTCTQYLQD